MENIPRLTILSADMKGQKYDLTEEYYAIGRSEECEICIVDPTVSGMHCELERTGDGVYLARDLGSTNGTRINGVRIDEQEMEPSDILQVGGVEIMYEIEGAKIKQGITQSFDVSEKEEANTDVGKLDPFGTKKDGKEDDPRVKLFFRIFIGFLILIVLVLLGILVRMLFIG